MKEQLLDFDLFLLLGCFSATISGLQRLLAEAQEEHDTKVAVCLEALKCYTTMLVGAEGNLY